MSWGNQLYYRKHWEHQGDWLSVQSIDQLELYCVHRDQPMIWRDIEHQRTRFQVVGAFPQSLYEWIELPTADIKTMTDEKATFKRISDRIMKI